MPRWTEEARQQQAERIRALCPWKKSTGPKTEAGKARSARNAWKGGVWADCAYYSRLLRETGATLREVFSSFGRKQGGGNAQHRTGESGEPGGAPSCSVRFAENHNTSRNAPCSLLPTNPFSSLGENAPCDAPCSPRAAELFSSFGQNLSSEFLLEDPDSAADPELEGLSVEDLMERMGRMFRSISEILTPSTMVSLDPSFHLQNETCRV